MNKNTINSVGELLRGARESKSVTLDAAHQTTKIAVRVLTALEQDDFDGFESDIYLKGFLKSYASYLDLDFNLVLQTLDRQRGAGPVVRGTLWDIEETVAEEKLKSPKIFQRIVVPVLIIAIIVLTWLFIRERQKNTKPQGRIQSETVDTRLG